MFIRKLPVSPTTFIGRDTEIAALIKLITTPDCRLITLVGPGGIGKTRLAIEVASHIPDTIFANGIRFVDLTPVQMVDNIVPTIATTVGYQFPTNENVDGGGTVTSNEDYLMDYFHQKNMLLLVDNAEHLPDSVFLIERILTDAPDVKILVTSRVPLNSRWEHLYEVHGLPVDGGAMELFADRAVRVQPRFDLQNEAACVSSICQLMEGMPLGLELAATWLRVLSCQELTDELLRNLGFLESRQRTVNQRHASLQAVFDQSWHLLTDAEREVLMRLSVFKGTFTRDAAQNVARASLSNLTALVDQSLVQVTPEGRYRLHELVRQLSAGKLSENPDSEHDTLNAHANYYSRFIEQQLPRLKSGEMPEALLDIETDIDNIRAAWNHALAIHDPAPIQRMAESLHHYFVLRAYASEGIDLYQAAIEVFDDNDIICYLKIYQAKFYEIVQEFDKRHNMIEEVFDRVQAMGNPALKAATLEGMSHGIRMIGGIAQGVKYLEQALYLFEAIGNPHDIANVFRSFAYTYATSDDNATLLYLQKSYQMAQQSGNQWQLAHTLLLLGNHNRIAGQVDEAFDYYQLGRNYARQFDHWGYEVDCLCGMAEIQLWNHSNYIGANRLSQEALSLVRNFGDKNRWVQVLKILGWVQYQQHNLNQCEQYWTECKTLAEQSTNPWALRLSYFLLGALEKERGNFEKSAHYYEEAISISKHLGDLPAVAKMYSSLSYMAFYAGRYAEGKRYAEHGLTVLEELSNVNRPELLAGAYTNLAHNVLELGVRRLALANYRQALDLVERNFITLTLETMTGVAKAIAYAGDLETAIRLLRFALKDDRFGEHRPVAQRDYDDLIAELPKDVVDSLLAEADKLTHEEAVELMLNHPIWREHGLDQPLVEPLSDRELEILRMVAKGKSNRQIAAELFLAVGTVKTHINHIMGKLDAQNRTEAVAKAQELGIL